MVRPATAKVWNDDLVTALEARADFARQHGKQRHHLWSEGARAIQAVRQDIYVFTTGRIVGLPEKKLKKTVAELCRDIIQGKEGILPTGYTPPDLTTAAAHGDANSLTRDYYLNRIKIRGGAFAILMAFYTRGFPVMTQDQVCQYAQAFCDEPMEANYMAGRSHGGWSGHKTLVSHQLLLQQKPQVQFTSLRGGGHGFRTALGARASYSLTDKGKLFVATLLEHRPEAKQEMRNYAGGVPRFLGGGGGGFAAAAPAASIGEVRGDFASPTLSAASSVFSTARGGSDEQDLRNWARTAAIGDSRSFNISKATRKALHDVCDELSDTVLRAQGRRIHHSSQGTGRKRTLVVSMEQDGVLGGTSSLDFMSDRSLFQELDPRTLTSHESHGETPPKRARTANQAAAEAAMLRAALYESSLSAAKQKPGRKMAPKQLYADSGSTESTTSKQGRRAASKPSSTASKPLEPIVLDDNDEDSDEDDSWLYSSATKIKAAKVNPTPPTILELSDSSDDDDDDDDDEDNNDLNKKPAARTRSVSLEVDDDVIVLTEDEVIWQQATSTKQATGNPSQQSAKLTIYIDNRERNKNATPRHLRMELTRILSNGLLRRVWPASLPAASVEERQLARGDFAFQATLNNKACTFPVAIERKTIADIVQRSVSQDHWKQLCQMRDGFEICCFLLEGDLKTAVQHTAYGSQDDETLSPMSHKIDDAQSLVRFVGRAMLSTPSFRLIQSDHEIGSLRSVAAFALMSLHHFLLGDKAPGTVTTKLQSYACAKQQLKDRLQQGGIPWQIAKLVSEEVGSVLAMNRLYASAEDEECRDYLLTPLIRDVCWKLAPLKGSAEQWSAAVHRVYFSPLPDIDMGRKSFEDYRDIVADQALLLTNIHSGMSGPDALDKTLTDYASANEATVMPRIVHIELPDTLDGCLPEPEDEMASIWKVRVGNDTQAAIPRATMVTRVGNFCSGKLFIFFLDGEKLISYILEELEKNTQRHIEMVKVVAETLHQDFGAHRPAKDRRVLLVRGLTNALGQAAKKAGYRSELPVLVDMLFAQLSLAHGIVIVQAARLKDDREMVVQELALTCYHFQPVLYKQE